MTYIDVSTVELLGRLIGRRNAKRLYRDSLIPLFTPEVEEAHHARLLAARELVRRWLEEDLRNCVELTNRLHVANYLQLLFADDKREVFAVLFLDNRHRLIATERMFFGTINGTSVYPREVVKMALAYNAAAVILSHNHPSGVADPSRHDEVISTKLREVLAIVDIRVLDHVVVGIGTVSSLAERGLL